MNTKTENFESALKKLEETVEKLEEGTISLNEALTTFESGIHWSRECKKFLDSAGPVSYTHLTLPTILRV